MHYCNWFIYFDNKQRFSQDFPTRGEVFNFDVGDIFHTHFLAYAGASGVAEHKNIEILSKFYSDDDSIVYYGRFIRGEVSTPDYPDWQYYEEFDTISFDNLYDTIHADTVYQDNNEYNGRKTTFSHFYDTIYYAHYTSKYTVGCGKVYYVYDEVGPNGSAHSESELVYFKKGDEEWGEEQIIIGIGDGPNMSTMNSLKVYPNPASVQVAFELPEISMESTLKIMDIFGKTITEYPIVRGQESLNWDCSNYKRGVYFYKTIIGGVAYSGKIIVQ